MGTSKGSKGPGKDVPFVPPWVPPLEQEPVEQEIQGPDQIVGPRDEGEEVEVPVPDEGAQLAPPRRFVNARRALGEFAKTGNTQLLQRGLGHYVRTGMGGTQAATRRMAGTARTAAALYDVLSTLSAGQSPLPTLDFQALAGLPYKQVCDRIVEAIQPADGTQDAEASRLALSRAFADLLDQYPNAELTALDAEQIEFGFERYLGHGLCRRLELDVGGAVEAKAPDGVTAARRMEEMRSYVLARVSGRAKSLRDRGEVLNHDSARRLGQSILRETYQIFEDYAQ